MALTGTCTVEARDTLMTQLCMDKAVQVNYSGDRPNIFLSTVLMPSKIDEWSTYLNEDISLVRTLGVNIEWTVYFCRTMKWLVGYMNIMKSLGCGAYFDPNGRLVPANRMITMYRSESAESVKRAVCEFLSDINGIVR